MLTPVQNGLWHESPVNFPTERAEEIQRRLKDSGVILSRRIDIQVRIQIDRRPKSVRRGTFRSRCRLILSRLRAGSAAPTLVFRRPRRPRSGRRSFIARMR